MKIVVDGVSFSEGDELTMGGGEYKNEQYAVSLVGSIPPSCRGAAYYLLTGLASK